MSGVAKITLAAAVIGALVSFGALGLIAAQGPILIANKLEVFLVAAHIQRVEAADRLDLLHDGQARPEGRVVGGIVFRIEVEHPAMLPSMFG